MPFSLQGVFVFVYSRWIYIYLPRGVHAAVFVSSFFPFKRALLWKGRREGRVKSLVKHKVTRPVLRCWWYRRWEWSVERFGFFSFLA